MPNATAAPASSPLSIALASRADTRKLGAALARAVAPGDLIVLEGDLGAGKTYLVQALARALGVPKSIPITSPTFELVHELPGRLPILHADLYRLTAGVSIEELGLAERIGGDAVVLVEWGDRFAAALGGDGLWLTLSLNPKSANARRCLLEPRGVRTTARWQAILPGLSAEFRPQA